MIPTSGNAIGKTSLDLPKSTTKKALRIGVDARPVSRAPLTGIGVYLNGLLNKLQELDQENHYWLISNGAIAFKITNPSWEKIEGQLPQKELSTLWMQCRIPCIASSVGLDLFWGTRHQLPLLLSTNVRTVLTVHDIVHLLFPETMSLPVLATERLFMRRSLQRADHVIADSWSTASGIQDHYPVKAEKISVIYPGRPISAESIHHRAFDDEKLPGKYFLFVGTLEPRKNLKGILNAFSLLDPETKRVDLLVVGNVGWKNKELLAMLESNNFRSRVHLKGYVDPDRLSHMYQHAVCLLYPSLYEGFGFPILEAMHHGVPVITSNVSSMPEVAGDAALLVDPADAHGLAEAMKKILLNDDLRNNMISKGYERVAQFSWERCAAATLAVFNQWR